ncbi:MAG: acetyl-CoA carboxylase biotin carboxylase subunit [Betaproteobacteria bacterium TMED82]|nr:MAG: acetyl-CoA carboxylase biotin carboxylase subunit [Betaproteobacteria bacterium TMED82]
MGHFSKILIANRGEIALRIQRACRELDIKTVAVHSTIDEEAKYVKLADESVCIGPSPSKDSYLNIPAIIAAAEVTNSEAIHPGYGFLSENSDFAEQVLKSGFTFIGPSPSVIKTMGNKIEAKKEMEKLGIPCIPGYTDKIPSDQKAIKKIASDIGYPIIIKAAGGGGGRGMKITRSEDELIENLQLTKTESYAAFGDASVYLEKFLESPRHIEIQLLSDNFGNVIHLGERDCSIQRKHQKLIEETPALGITEEEREKIGALCTEACKKINYQGAGTMEFLYYDKNFYFIEMNTRIQVEHPITESVTGVDLVQEQIKIAANVPLELKQKDIKFNGHAIECRINAEDSNTFMPSPGKILVWHTPGGPGVRVDSHVYANYVVPAYYDSMIGKIIVYGKNRKQALEKMRVALSEMIIEGISTNLNLHRELISDPAFKKGKVHINFLNEKLNL